MTVQVLHVCPNSKIKSDVYVVSCGKEPSSVPLTRNQFNGYLNVLLLLETGAKTASSTESLRATLLR